MIAGWIALAVLLLVLIGYLWWAALADEPAKSTAPTPRPARAATPRPRPIPVVRRGNTFGTPGTGPIWLVRSDEHLTLHGDTHGRYVLVDERSRARTGRRGRVPP